MALLKRATQIEIIEGVKITVDAEDVERIQARTWQKMPGQHANTVSLFTNLGTKSSPAFQLLSGFILGVQPSQYVEQIDKSIAGLLDYRKRNLRRYR